MLSRRRPQTKSGQSGNNLATAATLSAPDEEEGKSTRFKSESTFLQMQLHAEKVAGDKSQRCVAATATARVICRRGTSGSGYVACAPARKKQAPLEEAKQKARPQR